MKGRSESAKVCPRTACGPLNLLEWIPSPAEQLFCVRAPSSPTAFGQPEIRRGDPDHGGVSGRWVDRIVGLEGCERTLPSCKLPTATDGLSRRNSTRLQSGAQNARTPQNTVLIVTVTNVSAVSQLPPTHSKSGGLSHSGKSEILNYRPVLHESDAIAVRYFPSDSTVNHPANREFAS